LHSSVVFLLNIDQPFQLLPFDASICVKISKVKSCDLQRNEDFLKSHRRKTGSNSPNFGSLQTFRPEFFFSFKILIQETGL